MPRLYYYDSPARESVPPIYFVDTIHTGPTD